MTRIFLFILFFVGVSMSLEAQQIAKTNSGRVVVLFDNGTWKYVDDKPGAKDQSAIKEVVEEAKVIDTKIELKDTETQKLNFINGPSAKLLKYFKLKNIINADLSLVSQSGKVSLLIDWKVMTAEAFAYFGYIKEGSKISLELMGGKVVDLIYTEEFEPKEYEKYGFSTYKSQLELSPEQIALLQSSIITKATMTWTKRSEEYKITNPAYFVNELPKLMK
ncbi:hypothetical protein DWB61_01200 [Ancylomarina euxinus]|uniref:DUF3157 family protein n=1 Tax=Ancylomarina euxinus TaxID=2283627 RepID=A0A425Y819_9BACT|nr:hypothetical protein [Ancylomarina euxinus]MCZ4693471.1 hypothetical protein [Ancylomarina euxinus]MUP13698.1 hypothetical protein [Ancylomarina euxinus]RRG24661.1 hypothetical protein DWB61_01200 [Ancylomarina euxinus]